MIKLFDNLTTEQKQFILYNRISRDKIGDAIEYDNFYGRDSRTDVEMYLNILVQECIEFTTILDFKNLNINNKAVHNKVVRKSNNDPDFYTYTNNRKKVYVEHQSTIAYNKKYIEVKSSKYNNLMKDFKDECVYILQKFIDRNNLTCKYEIVRIQDDIEESLNAYSNYKKNKRYAKKVDLKTKKDITFEEY